LSGGFSLLLIMAFMQLPVLQGLFQSILCWINVTVLQTVYSLSTVETGYCWREELST
jgi:hypothetical protein